MPTTRSVEVERKYDVGDDAVLPSLADLPGVARVDPPVVHEMSAVYFDTPDLRLASRRITLRRRSGGSDAGWHLKLPGGPDERLEIHEPAGPDPDAVPAALLSLVRAHTRDRPLAPVARLDTRRAVHLLRGPAGEPLAEAADDRVRAQTLPPGADPTRWREWETELAGGPRDLLDAAGDLLTAHGARRSAHPTKLARALGPRLPDPAPDPPAPRRKGPAGDVPLAYLHTQVRELAVQDPRVRLDAPDAVHRMRVATRRARSALGTYRALLDAGAAEHLRAELRWLAGVLGQARDTEVMHDRLRDLLAAEPADTDTGPASRRVDATLGKRYRDAHDEVLRALDGDRYLGLLDGLDTLLAEPPLTPRAHRKARAVVPELVDRDARRLRRAVRDALEAPGGTGADPSLHEARKRGKRLRYAAEAATPLHPRRAARLAQAAQAVQQLLGEHQDSVVTRETLRELGTEAYADGEDAFIYGRLHGLEQARALEAETRFRQRWSKDPPVPFGK
ncbi:CYTH and CHAD domain-containing protein [Arthrobacter halodurans]|uniref:CHAD domain-containing protein n=1 Tax=Arthrobacter halodurans TaxID=516699 RepID=A0ABV4UJK2_9MICC